MEIENTPWKTISIRDKDGRLKYFGYEAPASEELLRKLQKKGIWVELVSDKGYRVIRPENKEDQKLEGKFLRMIHTNTTYPVFEEMLQKEHGRALPKDRFDEFVNFSDPTVWGRDDKGGYFLDLDRWPISRGKKNSIKNYFVPIGFQGKGEKALSQCLGRYVGNKVIVPQENVKELQNIWKWAAEQQARLSLRAKLKKQGKTLPPHVINLDEPKRLPKKASGEKNMSEKTKGSVLASVRRFLGMSEKRGA